MKKKYFFQSRFICFSYFLYSLPIFGMAYLTCIADTFHWWLLAELILFAGFLWFWGIWTISYRIVIDFNKKEICIKHPGCEKKIKFKEIQSIEIVECSTISFELHLITNKFSKKFLYKYFNKRGKWNFKQNVNELKLDFKKIIELNNLKN